MSAMMRRVIQLVALVTISSGGASVLQAELDCPASWGGCVPECVNPEGYCENVSPGCTYDAYCTELCSLSGMGHVLCIETIET